jgi:hypothetical protein
MEPLESVLAVEAAFGPTLATCKPIPKVGRSCAADFPVEPVDERGTSSRLPQAGQRPTLPGLAPGALTF